MIVKPVVSTLPHHDWIEHASRHWGRFGPVERTERAALALSWPLPRRWAARGWCRYALGHCLHPVPEDPAASYCCECPAHGLIRVGSCRICSRVRR